MVAGASWLHRFHDDLGLEVAYRHERRTSNEPDKGFNANQAWISFQYRFDRPGHRAPEPPAPR